MSTSEEIRAERNQKLANSDWAVLKDAPTNKHAWQVYRQALRDITEQDGFPDSVQWPTEPGAAQ